MKAVLLTKHGDASALSYTDVPAPVPARDEVVVRVLASGVNRMDLLVRAGYPGIPVKLPHVMGGDVVGEIVELGTGVRSARLGERVLAAPVVTCGRCAACQGRWVHLCERWQYLGLHRPGGYAELVALPQDDLVPLPDELTPEQAAALPVAGLTAYHALHGVAGLREGQTLFLWGGAGTLGAQAIGIARALGARVFAAASTAEKRALVSRLGAELALDPADPELEAQVRERAPGGVDVVFDFVGAQTFPRSFGLVRRGGQLLVCGMIGGREVRLDLQQTYLRHVDVRGLYLGTRAELAELAALAASRRFVPHLAARLPLARAAEAHALLEQRKNLGKIVLVP